MKKVLITLAALLCCTIITTSAQDVDPDRNRTYNIVLNNIQYAHHNEKMSAGDAVGAVLTGVLTGQTSVEATKYEDDVKSAIIKGLSSAHRFHYQCPHYQYQCQFEFTHMEGQGGQGSCRHLLPR